MDLKNVVSGSSSQTTSDISQSRYESSRSKLSAERVTQPNPDSRKDSNLPFVANALSTPPGQCFQWRIKPGPCTPLLSIPSSPCTGPPSAAPRSPSVMDTVSPAASKSFTCNKLSLGYHESSLCYRPVHTTTKTSSVVTVSSPKSSAPRYSSGFSSSGSVDESIAFTVPPSTFLDDLCRQVDELDALIAIFPVEGEVQVDENSVSLARSAPWRLTVSLSVWVKIGEVEQEWWRKIGNEKRFSISEGDKEEYIKCTSGNDIFSWKDGEIGLIFRLPKDYPSTAYPRVELVGSSALASGEREALENCVKEAILDNTNQEVLVNIVQRTQACFQTLLENRASVITIPEEVVLSSSSSSEDVEEEEQLAVEKEQWQGMWAEMKVLNKPVLGRRLCYSHHIKSAVKRQLIIG